MHINFHPFEVWVAVAWYNFKLFNLELGGGGGLMMFLLLLSLLTSVHRINKLRRRDTQITKARHTKP